MDRISHNLLRIVTGFLLFQHGAPKLFGIFGGFGRDGGSAEMLTLMWFAGVLEVFGGLAVMVGLYTKPVAFILSGELAVAYFMSHFPRALLPIENRGELAALYSFVFLFLAFKGGGDWSIDAKYRGKD